jgi:hypothetical protein
LLVVALRVNSMALQASSTGVALSVPH